MHYTSQFMGLWRNVPCYRPVSWRASDAPASPASPFLLLSVSPPLYDYLPLEDATQQVALPTHTHTHTEKNVIKRHKKIWQFIWWQKKTISRGMPWLSISKRSKFKDQGRGPSHPRSPFVPSNRYSQICTVCLCLVSLPRLCIGSVHDMMICLFWFCFIFFFKFLHFVNKVLLYILFQHDIAQ